MEGSEPNLVPEWLRGTGRVTGGGTSTHHFASSSSQSGNDSLLSFTCLSCKFLYTYQFLKQFVLVFIWL